MSNIVVVTITVQEHETSAGPPAYEAVALVGGEPAVHALANTEEDARRRLEEQLDRKYLGEWREG